jgi:FdhE protein
MTPASHSRPRPERADSPELAAFRRLREDHPELASAVDMQVEIVVLQRRLMARISTPWLDLDPGHTDERLRQGRPIVGFQEIRFDWGEFRLLFRQIADVLRRYDLIEPQDTQQLQQISREGRPSPQEVAAWYAEHFERYDHDTTRAPAQPDTVGQVLAVAARPFLARVVDALHQRVDLRHWTRPYCPFCGGDAELALLLRAGERRLACGRCTGVWPFPEDTCPHCENRLPGSRTSFGSADGWYRLIACDVCRRYVKAFDARQADRPFLLDVDTIATLPLDAAAQQRGYLS